MCATTTQEEFRGSDTVVVGRGARMSNKTASLCNCLVDKRQAGRKCCHAAASSAAEASAEEGGGSRQFWRSTARWRGSLWKIKGRRSGQEKRPATAGDQRPVLRQACDFLPPDDSVRVTTKQITVEKCLTSTISASNILHTGAPALYVM